MIAQSPLTLLIQRYPLVLVGWHILTLVMFTDFPSQAHPSICISCISWSLLLWQQCGTHCSDLLCYILNSCLSLIDIRSLSPPVKIVLTLQGPPNKITFVVPLFHLPLSPQCTVWISFRLASLLALQIHWGEASGRQTMSNLSLFTSCKACREWALKDAK